MVQKTWKLIEPNLKLAQQISNALKISTITAQILINRGLSAHEDCARFLKPDLKDLPNPFLLPDMEKGVSRLVQAIQNHEKIAVFGDYDVDGLSSSALFALFFKEIGIEIITYIPDRIKEGYGVNKEAIAKLKNQGVSLIITVDCGTKSQEALEHAKNLGVDVIVTDHHLVDEAPPPAYAFINPQVREGIGKELCGVGIVFFLLLALRQKLRGLGIFGDREPNLKQHLDLVAFATIADMAALTGINRTLVFYGLKELAATKKAGLVALKEIAGLADAAVLQTSDIGFRLGPRINAGGRIAKASLGLDLLISDDLERAKKLAKLLDQCNQDRQEMQEKSVREALAQAEEKPKRLSMVVASEHWHPGIVGLIASKMVENFYLPAIAFSIEKEMAKGSARSISGIDICEILKECSHLLEKFGGHASAAGVTLETKNLNAFEDFFDEILQKKCDPSVFKPSLRLDCELKLQEIEENFLNELELLKPFGIKNPEPVFLSRSLMLSDTRIVGKNHLKFKVSGDPSNSFEAIGFDLASHHPLHSMRRDVAFVPQYNTYLNVRSVQLKVKDIKIG